METRTTDNVSQEIVRICCLKVDAVDLLVRTCITRVV